MEELRKAVAQLSRAVFGDPDDPKAKPGIVHELARMEAELKRSNEILEKIQANLSKLIWIIIGAVVVALLKLVLTN